MSGATSRRRFLRGVAGLSFGAASLGMLAACRGPAARPASKRLPLIGYFAANTEQADKANAAALREGLAALGYRGGQTITIEWRYADYDRSSLAAIAQGLVDLRPDIIVVSGLPQLPFVRKLTRSIPIVAVLPLVIGSEQLIRLGGIESQAHPGGNLTGLIGSTPTLYSKRLDLLHEMVPGATRLAILKDSASTDLYSPYPGWTSDVISLGISAPEDLDGAFATFDAHQAELLAVALSGGRITTSLDQITEQARRHRLPATGDTDNFAASGGLMSYTADLPTLFRGAGRFVDKILKGAAPADLAIELPTAFNFVINKATADALGVTIPPAVLAQATEVLQ